MFQWESAGSRSVGKYFLKPREYMLRLEVMTRWIDVGKTEECVAVYAGWHRVDRHTVGGIDKFSVVVILECLRCTGGCYWGYSIG